MLTFHGTYGVDVFDDGSEDLESRFSITGHAGVT